MRIGNSKAKLLVLGATAMSFVLTSHPLAAQSFPDYPVCYKVIERNENAAYHPGYYAPDRLVLDVLFHSKLRTTGWGGNQNVYDADGKHTYWRGRSGQNLHGQAINVMAVFDGSIVTSSGGRKQPHGAHLGGTSYFVRDNNLEHYGPGGGPYTRPIFWECTSAEHRPVPDTWSCTIVSDDHTRGVYLKKVKHNRDQKCDIFQDTQRYYPNGGYIE
ncbi:hypothetical protein [Geminicoccus roseus]|uniref:hypothetical protein n=1 Tax=Geminicoccus roseus TaxID=404900 RepID=UPI0012F87658|nr:hypothetical protein [Geminicoccus roseus]